jgi:hypothetical protein
MRNSLKDWDVAQWQSTWSACIFSIPSKNNTTKGKVTKEEI